ncbi:/ rpmB / 50S ribosomal protein L28 /:512989 Forward [Candidatus Hepatoplasma crinochetorum]|uniref:Large ribosomal subunit protein bL28 n=1 Tax=Candidatus Hepatoplasma crinochetorum TaxID=295596 RepID=A0A0G7ZNC1_9MOLU|nr:/ rpmB / 50S ribosomal protein L28 /:512989 Forward [Candidatus Hepatoplasma crinochetorum]
MSRKCDILNKGPQYGNSRSKSLNARRKKWNANLQPIKVTINGKEQKLMLSTKMIKTIKNKGQENIALVSYK